MISLRYHVVSITAVFLALAIGVVLGSTSLSERVLSSVGAERNSLGDQVEGLRTQRDGLQADLAAANRFGSAVGPLAVRGQLSQRSVVLISTWDTPPQERDEMRKMLGSSGAAVTGELQLNEGLANPDRADQLRQVSTGLLPAGAQLPTATDPGTLAGGMLGPLTTLGASNGGPQASPQERDAGLSGLSGGGFANVVQDVQPAQLAVVLTGGNQQGERAADKASTVARLATQMDRSGSGAVLAGSGGAAGGSAPVGVARADPSIASGLSTVDNADSASGRVSTVLALREQLDRQAGHYGVAGNAQGAAPNVRS